MNDNYQYFIRAGEELSMRYTSNLVSKYIIQVQDVSNQKHVQIKNVCYTRT